LFEVKVADDSIVKSLQTAPGTLITGSFDTFGIITLSVLFGTLSVTPVVFQLPALSQSVLTDPVHVF